MKKLESSLKNMLLVLTGVTAISVALLAYVNQLTAEPIAEAEARALSDAVRAVVPGFDNDPIAEQKIQKVNGVDYAVYPATKGGTYIGAAIEASTMGFGGTLHVLVGFDAEGNIFDYSLLSHAETPGLGSKESGQGAFGCGQGRRAGGCHHCFHHHDTRLPFGCQCRIRRIRRTGYD